MRTSVKSVLGGLSVGFLLVACGGDFPTTFDGGEPKPVDVFGDAGHLGEGDAGDLSKCATASAAPTPIPVNLVFMFDQSGSMKDSSKWTSCAQGLNGFFADASSKGLNASIQYFPQGQSCSTSVFQNPDVSMRALPDSASFSKSIAAHAPSGGTPTLPAIKGAIEYAKQIQAQRPGERVAIVLVTDGEPNDCSSSASAVALEAAGISAKIPTYVIGVGSSLQNLDLIAAGGGTSKATIVQTNNPQQIVSDFESALNRIRGQTLACEYTIPSPPNGAALDYSKVNVVYTPANQMSETLAYSQDCSNPKGWKYDAVKAPTKIQLCSSACGAVQAQQGAKIEVVFGCKTNVVVR